MTRLLAGPLASTLILIGYATAWSTEATAPAMKPHPQVDRPHLVEAMKANCFSQHGDAAAEVKAKCDCYAHAFVESLTDGEIAVPQRSAAINAKLAAARHSCRLGDF